MLSAILTAGCSRGQPSNRPAAEASDARTYVVRGEVISVPQAGKPGMQFIVKHELTSGTDDFRNRAATQE
jgi:hypothetical protein